MNLEVGSSNSNEMYCWTFVYILHLMTLWWPSPDELQPLYCIIITATKCKFPSEFESFALIVVNWFSAVLQ